MSSLFYEITMLLFTYSFLAWIAETTVAAIKLRDFRNRSSACSGSAKYGGDIG